MKVFLQKSSNIDPMHATLYLPDVAYKCDVVALEDDAADLPAGPALLEVDFLCLVEHGVHVLVEADDLPLDAQVRVLVEPDLHSRLRLEELVDQELYTYTYIG